MIIANEKTDVSTSGITQTARATIKASSRLFSFFSDQIYADKFVAIWRELVANGMDAQVAAGNPQQQMIVTLPTDYTPYAKVRDFGTGMGHEFLMTKFMAYTDASTKENSNDFIGGFGIGSKAPLSYTEQFAIHSYQNGEVGIYSVFKDDEGCPAIAFLGRHASVEPDGVEISFPVEGKDIKAFRDAAPKTLQYFRPLPLLVNSEQQIFPPEYTVTTDTWGFLKGVNNSRVVQGGIAYPIDAGSVKEIDNILGFGIDFFVPIGSCSIALSRERLSYDERTIRVLKSLVDAIRPDLEKHVSEMFANCATLWEAQKLYWAEMQNYTNQQRRSLVASHAKYKGLKLDGRFKPMFGDKLSVAMVTTNKYQKAGYNNWTTGTASPTVRPWMADIYPRDVQMILIDDGCNKPILRARNYMESNNLDKEGVVLFRPKHNHTPAMTKREWAQLLIHLGRPPFKLLSEIEPAVVTRTASVREQKVRAYLTGPSFTTPGRTTKFVDEVPATGGYYMRMDSFQIIGKDDKGVELNQPNATQLMASGIDPTQLYYFNKGDYEVIKDNPLWKPAVDKYNETLKDYVQNHRNLHLTKALYAVSQDYYGRGARGGLLLRLIDLGGFELPKQGPLYQLSKLYALVKADFTPKDNAMRELLEIKSEPQQTLVDNLVEEVKIKYPELWTIVGSPYVNGVRADWVPVYNKLV